jgi:phosphoglucomutase / phosphopentomutase
LISWINKNHYFVRSVVAEMAVYLQEVENKTLLEKLDWIYDTYGFHVSNNSYFLCYSQETIEKMFDKLRHFDGF